MVPGVDGGVENSHAVDGRLLILSSFLLYDAVEAMWRAGADEEVILARCKLAVDAVASEDHLEADYRVPGANPC